MPSNTPETQALLPVTAEDVDAALATFDGGLVRQNDERNARGYTTFYHPKDSMRAVLEEFSASRISHSLPGDVGMREACDDCGGQGIDTSEFGPTKPCRRCNGSGRQDPPLLVPRNPTDDMVQAGLYQLGVGGDEWAMIYQIWTDMFDALAMDGGLTARLPARGLPSKARQGIEAQELLVEALNYLELVLSTDPDVPTAEADYASADRFLDRARAALTPSALSGEPVQEMHELPNTPPTPDRIGKDAVREALPQRCDGIEQPAFEEWAKAQGFDMTEHPLHYLFLDARTDAARQAWCAGIKHASDRIAALSATPAQDGEGDD